MSSFSGQSLRHRVWEAISSSLATRGCNSHLYNQPRWISPRQSIDRDCVSIRLPRLVALPILSMLVEEKAFACLSIISAQYSTLVRILRHRKSLLSTGNWKTDMLDAAPISFAFPSWRSLLTSSMLYTCESPGAINDEHRFEAREFFKDQLGRNDRQGIHLSHWFSISDWMRCLRS